MPRRSSKPCQRIKMSAVSVVAAGSCSRGRYHDDHAEGSIDRICTFAGDFAQFQEMFEEDRISALSCFS